jgi:hypothetical protein
MAISRADQVKALEHAWWRRIPRMLWRPHEVFAELDDSDDTAAALSEPIVAVTFLAGIAMFFATSTAGRLNDNGGYDWMLVGVEAIVAGALVALQTYWIGGAALLLGLRSFGSMARYRIARHVVGLSTVPFALALVVVWPIRIAIFGGDLFRSGGSDEGTVGAVLTGIDAAFAAWALGLVIVGVRALEGWSWPRTLGASSFAAALFALLVVAAVLR